MQSLTKLRSLAVAACAVGALGLAAPSLAQPGGVVIVRGGGYYGYGGWYGGYYSPWAWGGPGLYFATRPYYAAYGYYGYYYPVNAYDMSDPAAGQYGTAGQPAASAERRPVWSEIVVYPKRGQSSYQQSTDRYQCYRWAVAQLGYDPTTAGGGTVRGDLTDYNRAQTACLTARGYSVR
jgi:hypothetical protein